MRGTHSPPRVPLWLAIFLIVTLNTDLLGMQATSTITGLVKDATEALVPGTDVEVRNLATDSARQTQTNESGRFRVTNLTPGRYEVAVSRPGFRTLVTQAEVTVGEVAHLTLTLAFGEISEKVIVTDSVAPVDVEQGRVSSHVDRRQILDLPLNGRNVYRLIHLTPGAVDTTATVWEPGGNANINGGRANMNGFWMDGVSTTTLDGGTGNETEVGGQPNLEAIQEFRIETLNFSAEFGDSAASIVNVVSKSGSNEFHGSIYAFHRNDNLDAREFFDEQKPEFKQNQFGFSLGGPIARNRTFFFGSYEGTRIRTGESKLKAFESREWSGFVALYGSPVARYLFSHHPAPDLDSVTTTVGEYLSDGYIDSADQSSVDSFLGEVYGSPRGALSAHAPMTGEAGFFTPDFSDTNTFSLRIDQELGQDDKVYGRYFSIDSDFYWPTARPGIGESNLNQTHLAALNWTRIFGANIVNEARAGYTRYAAYADPTLTGIPWIGEAGWNTVFASGGPQDVRENIFTWADTLSLMTGNHGLKMGVEVQRDQQNSEWNAGVPSYYFFDLVYLALDDPYYQGAGVDPHLDLGPGQAELASNARGWRATEVGLFFNDDWKLLPNLTLNLGVRWDWYGRVGEVQNRATAFDMSFGGSLQERVYNGSFVGPVDRLSEEDWNNLAPRLGFAWDPFGNGRLSIRGGYGIAFQSAIYNPLANSRWNKPFYSVNAVCPLCGFGNNVLYGPQDGNPVRVDGPNGNPGASQQIGNIIAYDGTNPNLPFLTAIPNPKMRDPYVQSFFLGIQRDLAVGTTVEANYVGTLGRKIIRAEDFNRYPGDHLGAPNPVSGENGGDTGLNRINGEEGVLRFWENSVSSNYHALQVHLSRRYANNLAFRASYTLAKSLDIRSTWHNGMTTSNWLQEGFSTDVYNQRLDYGRSVFDARHRFTASGIWEIPWLRNSDHWFVGAVLGGWQANGILSLQSGQPFTPHCSRAFGGGCDWNADGSRNDRPDTPAAGNSLSSSRSDFVNPNAGIFNISGSSPDRPPDFADRLAYFGAPEPGSNGTLGRNTYEGPGFAGLDLSLFKEIGLSRWSEGAQLQIRFEFFNLFNRVNFFQPEPDLQFQTFGRAIEAFDAREIQVGVKILF